MHTTCQYLSRFRLCATTTRAKDGGGLPSRARNEQDRSKTKGIYNLRCLGHHGLIIYAPRLYVVLHVNVPSNIDKQEQRYNPEVNRGLISSFNDPLGGSSSILLPPSPLKSRSVVTPAAIDHNLNPEGEEPPLFSAINQQCNGAMIRINETNEPGRAPSWHLPPQALQPLLPCLLFQCLLLLDLPAR